MKVNVFKKVCGRSHITGGTVSFSYQKMHVYSYTMHSIKYTSSIHCYTNAYKSSTDLIVGVLTLANLVIF